MAAAGAATKETAKTRKHPKHTAKVRRERPKSAQSDPETPRSLELDFLDNAEHWEAGERQGFPAPAFIYLRVLANQKLP